MQKLQDLAAKVAAYINSQEPYPGLPESQPLLVRKLAGRVGTLAAGVIVSYGGPFSGFAQVLAGIAAMAFAETATDFWARAKVSPAWKLGAAYRAGVEKALDQASDTYDRYRKRS